MPITVTTWNINSVRLRINLVARFIKAVRPDVLCLQETKCPDDDFPFKRFKRLGYDHVALNGQKGYHGVVVALAAAVRRISAVQAYLRQERLPAHLVVLGERAGLRDPITLHNFYVPAGGDEPDPDGQRKICPQARFPRRDARLPHACARRRRSARSSSATSMWRRSNRCLEPQAIAQGRLRTRRSRCEKLLGLQKAGNWIDAVRTFVPEPMKILHLVELPLAGLGHVPTRPPARSHLGRAGARRPLVGGSRCHGVRAAGRAPPIMCR